MTSSTKLSAMASTPLLSTRRTSTPGIRLNPNRSSSALARSPSATSEWRGKGLLKRPPSDVSYLSGPETLKSAEDDDDVFATDEKMTLLKYNTIPDPEMGSSLSMSAEGSGGSFSVGDTHVRKGSLLHLAKRGKEFWVKVIKVIAIFVITVMCSVVLVSMPEAHEELHEAIADKDSRVVHSQNYDQEYPILQLKVMGPLSTTPVNASGNGPRPADLHVVLNPSSDESWTLHVNETAREYGDLFEFTHKFRCNGSAADCNISLRVAGENGAADNTSLLVPLVYMVDNLSHHVDNEIIYAALILIFVYILIIFELVHRTLAAMLGALAALAVLAAINQRPTTEVIMGWVEMETLMLLFGMMIIVAVLSDTGIFDYSALKAYKLAKGKVWRLVTLLCAFSAIVSAFLDNVTTILLMAPVTIRLCEVLNLDPRVILIAEVLFSNIGGTATAIGDPPNVIIVGSLEGEGISFTTFTAHLVVGILFVSVVAYGFLRLYYRNMAQLSNPDPPEIAELHHEIDMWRRQASRQMVVTREETLMKALFMQKAVELENQLNKMLHRRRRAERRDLSEQIRQLEAEYRIKDWQLLTKCGGVLVVVLTIFFLYSFVSDIHIGLGWIAVLGAMWLLVLADLHDLESILHRVEWSTLLFFAALFILMEALAELKLMEWIGDKISDVVTGVHNDHRLTVAVVIVTWVSALASSFIDNIPYTTAMIPVLKQLSSDPNVNLPLLPLVMCLAFGACLGGNGTLIGASANVVCAGIAEQHGYTINFKQFFKVGFPMMLVTVATASVYLLICHSAIGWNAA